MCGILTADEQHVANIGPHNNWRGALGQMSLICRDMQGISDRSLNIDITIINSIVFLRPGHKNLKH